MTQQDFNCWWNGHCLFYPGLNVWLEKQRDPAAILSAWAGVLSSITLVDAEKASEQLYGQEKQPQAYERHAAAVRAIASANRAERVEAQQQYARYGQTFRCRECSDSGWCVVPIQEPLLSKAVRQVGEAHARRLTQAVVCRCDVGDKIADMRNRSEQKHPIRFDPMTMVNRTRLNASEPPTKDDWEKFRKVICGVRQPEAIAPVIEETQVDKVAREFYGPGADG